MHPLVTMHSDHFVCRQSVHLFLSVRPSICPTVYLSRFPFAGATCIPRNTGCPRPSMNAGVHLFNSFSWSVRQRKLDQSFLGQRRLSTMSSCTANQWRSTRMFIFHVKTSYFWQVFSGFFFQFSVSESD